MFKFVHFTLLSLSSFFFPLDLGPEANYIVIPLFNHSDLVLNLLLFAIELLSKQAADLALLLQGGLHAELAFHGVLKMQLHCLDVFFFHCNNLVAVVDA